MAKHDSNKPQWLLNLEQESWQAELIISGLAIWGSLQLPNLIDQFGYWAIAYFTSDMGFLLYILQFSLYIASSGLIIGFILHFILRAIWIGFIGLNSVFPDGIKTDHSSYSRIFLENIKRDFSLTNENIQGLDRVCSSMFAVCAIILLISLIFVSNVLILYGLKVLFDQFLPSNFQWFLIAIFGLLIMGGSVLFYLMHSKWYKENERFQKRGYAIYNILTFLAFHVFRKPYFSLVNTLMSNTDKKKFLGYMTIAFIPLIFLTFSQFLHSGTLAVLDLDGFYKNYARNDMVHNDNYESYISANNKPIFSALLESELVNGRMMKVFIPILENEEPVFTDLCGTYEEEEEEELDKDQKRENRRMYYLNCYHKYHKVSVNDEMVNADFIKHYHPHKNTFGILT